eukprot:TRINITY_DN3143_c0_g3_i1.p3 TRINITY_DN3143_c0_g3~~TRINITY_DN3143_c0_g3_i1.p3  ORF type:complete len:121 (-),score=11.78 TRINITY_DN3143_c0_g3_i1:342-704(-)
MGDYKSYLGAILFSVLGLIVVVAVIVHFCRKCTCAVTLDLRRSAEIPSGQTLEKPAAYSDERCVICLGQIQYPIQTCCGHVFCANCILRMWESENHRQLSCPLCRRTITLFFEFPFLDEH